MIFLSILAILFWFGGYFLTARFMSTTGATSDDLEKIIAPPKWLYYLCGAPVSKKYPTGTMRVVAFQSQMAGISFGLFSVWSLLSKPSYGENLVGFAFGVLFPFVITAYISKHYGLKNQSKIQKGRK
jgi:hypothetical protein